MNKKDLKILIVEDEFIALTYLQGILSELGINNILSANDSKKAEEIAFENELDLVFMDINLGQLTDGILCAKLINEKHDIPIIYTTAYADEETLNYTKETNIFGYIIKPFDSKDVESTLNIAMRFISKNSDKTKELKEYIEINEYKYYKKTRTLKHNERVINLTKKESLIFHLLISKLNQNISYSLLIEEVWQGTEISTSTIRDTVSRLKRKVPNLDIKTISSYGYILKK